MNSAERVGSVDKILEWSAIGAREVRSGVPVGAQKGAQMGAQVRTQVEVQL